ncbi:MAG: ABC transporter permease [Bacteroidota bacterium]
MKIIFFIVQKEFLQIFRNRLMLGIILVVPVIQLMVLAYAATFEIRNIDMFVVDQDQTPESRALIDRFTASENFRLKGWSVASADGDRALLSGKALMVLQIPAHAGRDLVRDGHAPVSVRFDAVDGYSASVASQYASQIIRLHNEEQLYGQEQLDHEEQLQGQGQLNRDRPDPHVMRPAQIGINISRWYNPRLDYKIYMVPGILVMLVTVIGGFLTGMNVVREKEIGTIEQLNVTPISKIQFIIGKLLPFMLLALLMFSIGLILARYWFEVPLEGSLWLVYLATTTYLLVVLGLGLLVSTITHSQQQAIFITWFVFVIFILLSGLFTPIDSMPDWAQYLTWANPVAWFIDIIRRVMLTGADLHDIWISYLVLLAYSVAFLGSAVVRYRKSAV